MKKGITAILALALAASLSVTAFAAEGSAVGTVPGSQSIEVRAGYQDTSATPEVYSVDISWGHMEFTYTRSGSMVWNADSHTFTDNTAAAWSADGSGITVTNHSNMPVLVSFAFTRDTAVTEAITGSFDISSKILREGEVNKKEEADSVTSSLTLSGALASDRTTLTKIGTVRVTLSASGIN